MSDEMTSMNLKIIVNKTLDILVDDGFDNYLPTLIYENKILALEGIPLVENLEEKSHRLIAQDWVKKVNPGFPYIIIYLDSLDSVLVVLMNENGPAECHQIDRKDNKLYASKII